MTISIPTTREAVRCVWAQGVPDYRGVTDAATADRVLNGLLRAALDMLIYRKLAGRRDAIHMVGGDSHSYSRYAAADERTADGAVVLAHALAEATEEAKQFADLIGGKPPFSSCRIVILCLEDGYSVSRLELDPESRGGVTWYGRFDNALFAEVATGFALFVTHLVANVFDDDDGTQTFEESFQYVV
jgi:hypothetical protein